MKTIEGVEVEVSIYVLCFNHGKYIRKALDNLVSQKVKFKYEIILHDDASTDDSQDIILEYVKKYPDIIKPILQKENQFSKGVDISVEYIYPKCSGRFIAYCECDDYWCDPNKLQNQYDEMITQSDCSMCTHLVQKINEDGSFINETIPKSKTFTSNTKLYGINILEAGGYPFQTSSYFVKREVIEKIQNEFQNISGYLCEDARILLVSSLLGNVYFINKAMSCYRTGIIGSWNSKYSKSSIIKKIQHLKDSIMAYTIIDKDTKYEFHTSIQKKIAIFIFAIALLDPNTGKEMLNDYFDNRNFFRLEHKLKIKFVLLKASPLLYRKLIGNR